jgi:hypothetical protein
MTALNKDSKPPLEPRLEQDAEQVTTHQTSTSKQQDESHQTWWNELGPKMVEASKRMRTDPEYRRMIQSMTR